VAASTWLQPEVKQVLTDGSPAALRSVLREMCTDSVGYGVYQIDLFTDAFCNAMLSELNHHETSGIPLRRPNGMNRYGAILSDLGFQKGLLEPIMSCVMLPFARVLWPTWVTQQDCADMYGFVVTYEVGGDLSLAEHSDTSNVTLNACLGSQFTGGDLYFKGVRFTDSEDDKRELLVSHTPGKAVIHLGGHVHGAHPITSGKRSNLILWATGKDGVVRIRPDNPDDPNQISPYGHESGCKCSMS